MSDAFAPRSMKRRNVKGLALTPAAPKPPPTAESASINNSKNGDDPNQLEIDIEFNLDLRPQDIEVIKDLGAGNGGSVSKVRHLPTNMVMARKVGLPRSLNVVYHPCLTAMLGR
jgi:mitogen-activated protein kinase kinase